MDLQRNYEVDVFVVFTDASGDIARVDGVPTWIVSSPAFTLLPAADGMSVVVQATGDTIGETAIVEVRADADLGEGVTPVVHGEVFTIVSGTASTAEFTFGEPRPIAS